MTKAIEREETGPERLCIATRAVLPVGDLLRFVAGPEGQVVPDIRNRLPGRGVWVRNDRETLALAIKKKAFARGLKVGVTVPDGLIDQVDRLLEQDALQMLSLANKAGAIVTGFAKIAEGKGALLALVQAKDGSSAEIARLQGLCRQRAPRKGEISLLRLFDAAQLGLSLGREHVIHAALMVHETGAAFVARARRLADFRSGGPTGRDTSPVSGPSGSSEIANESTTTLISPVPVEDDDTND